MERGDIVNDRIRQVRRSETVNLTLEKFGERLGVTRAAISNVESGRRQPTNQLITAICREFNVNETWLRTGEGDMFNAQTPEDELAFQLGRILGNGNPSFKKRMIAALAALNDDEWAAIEAFARKLLEQSKETPPNE